MPFSFSPGRLTRLTTIGAATLVVAAGCASPIAAPTSTITPSIQAQTGPVLVDNCGTKVDFPAAPERVITVKSSATELMLALGLGDRIVAYASPDGDIPAEWAPQREIPMLAEKNPGKEAALALEPDLIFAGWESVFSADGTGTRPDLLALGVRTYVAPSACKEPGYKPDSMTIAELQREIRELAAIFRVDAEGFISQQQAILDSIKPDERKLTAAWYSSGGDTPYMGAGMGTPQLIMDIVGLTNIAADVHDTWAPMSWEAVIAADPDVFVLADSDGNPAAKKIARLQDNPATAALTAVRENRFLIIPFAAAEAGARTIPAAADLAARLAAMKIG